MAYPAPYAAAPAVPQENRIIQELSMPIYQARGWLKFLGVLTIISGIGSVALLVGILPIWMGVLLFQAGSNIEAAAQLGDRYAYYRSLGALKTYFVIQGILTLLGILIGVAMACIMFVLPLLGVTLIPWREIINSIPYNY